ARLATAHSPGPAAQQALGRYHVDGAATREQRSAINATGADIEEILPDSAEIVATPEQVQQIRALGFTVRPSARALDFPPIDADYHNYDELTAEVQSVAATHPQIAQLFSIGRSYEG